MPKKTLDNWRFIWDCSSETNVIKTQLLLRQYVIDSQAGATGVLHPMTWFAASNGKNVQYLSSDPVAYVLKNVTFDCEVEFLLRHLKQRTSHFYSIKFPDIADICEDDELRHILQVIKEKTGVDYFAIELTQDAEVEKAEEHQKASHV